jgi:hypothetical protein
MQTVALHADDTLTESAVDFPGPFTHHDVVVNGWRVPFLEAHMRSEDAVTLLLDRRYGLDLSLADAERVVPFLADAISIALGYPSHPTGEIARERAPHPRPVRTIDIARTEQGGT